MSIIHDFIFGGFIMIKLRYGKQEQVSFRDLNEYYFALGFLANSNNADLRWENNEDLGAWGSEGRIHCLVPQSKFPQFFRFTAGRGAVYARINCNEYVACLIYDHHFNYNGSNQDVNKILETVPEKYRGIFKEGFGSNLDINPTYKKPRSYSHTENPRPKVQTTQDKQENESAYTNSNLLPVRKGDIIIHKAFGRGVVYSVKGKFIHIRFSTVGEKMFINPDAFERGFLKKE